MMPILLHIPHASLSIPDRSRYVCGEETLKEELRNLTDWFTDELFDAAGSKAIAPRAAVVSPVSRLFCDVERFADDAQEVMAARGMGVCYTKTTDSLPLRHLSEEARRQIIRAFYLPHHESLIRGVDAFLQSFGKCLIVDCHSFPSAPLPCDLDQSPSRPDICLGTDTFHTSPDLVECAKSHFIKNGFSVEINQPYAGCLIPSPYYKKDQRVGGIMIEVNRATYMDEQAASKIEAFSRVRQCLQSLLRNLSHL